MRDGKRLGKVMVVALILSLFTVAVVGLSVTAQDEDEIDTAWGLGGLAIGGLCCIIILIPFIILILIAVWVYKDAEKRGMGGVLWVIIVIFVPYFIGLIIYLIVRRGHPIQQVPPPGYPPQQPGYPPQQQPYYPPQQPGYPPQQPPQQPPR